MERRKEFIKSIILLILVTTSIILTFEIAWYKPNYEILGISSDKQRASQDYQKLQQNSVNLLSPHIITKKISNSYEVQPLPNTITRVAQTEAVKNIDVIKQVVKEISSSQVDETRVRNKNIQEIINGSQTNYILNYRIDINTISSKTLYLGEDNQATSFDFDRVVISESNPKNLYLYKSGSEDSYMQVEFEESIFEKVADIFNENAKLHWKYSIDGRSDMYVPVNDEYYYIDEYSFDEIDISDVSSNIFVATNNLKVSYRDGEATREITDGYSILREFTNNITYINPSAVSSLKSNITPSEIKEKASNFLISGYTPNLSYEIVSVESNTIKYQERYKEGLVFSDSNIDKIKVVVNEAGVHQVTIPRKVKLEQLSSTIAPLYYVENVSEVLNYIYSNIYISNVEDIELGYEKTYTTNGNFIYTPAWYVKYKGEYIKYSKLKERLLRGTL